MSVPITPVGAHGCASYCANSCAAAAADGASNYRTTHSSLRKCIRQRYRTASPSKSIEIAVQRKVDINPPLSVASET